MTRDRISKFLIIKSNNPEGDTLEFLENFATLLICSFRNIRSQTPLIIGKISNASLNHCP
jgi:hypothetical protein